MAGWVRGTLACVLACLVSVPVAAATGQAEVSALDLSVADPAAADVLSGALDDRFGPMNYRDLRRRGGAFWLRVTPEPQDSSAGLPTLVAHKGRHLQVEVFARRGGTAMPLAQATQIPNFSGVHDAVFVLPGDLSRD